MKELFIVAGIMFAATALYYYADKAIDAIQRKAKQKGE